MPALPFFLSNRRRMDLLCARLAGAPLAAGLIAAGLVGCATPRSPVVGETGAQLQSAWGPPTAVLPLPEGGTRLEYAQGPMGRRTWMVDLDRDARVQQWTQVLTEPRFNAVKAGMDAQALRQWLGRPSQRRPGGWPGGEVWSWRYEAVFCQWFQVSLDDRQQVTSTAYTPDPLCDDDAPALSTRK